MDNRIIEEKYYDINLLFESIKLTTGLEINELINFFNKVNIKNKKATSVQRYMLHSLYVLNNLNEPDDYIKKVKTFYGIIEENDQHKILGSFLNILIYNITNNFNTFQNLKVKKNKVYIKQKTS